MRKPVVAGLALMTILGGCTPAGPAVAPLRFPSDVAGIPVHLVEWNHTLPYTTPSAFYIPWRTRAPGNFVISPQSAILRSLQAWPALDKLAKVIYIQPAGLAGGRTGDPPSAYVVEFAAHSLGFNGAPGPLKPPTMEFQLIIVNGRTGSTELAVGGGWPPEELIAAMTPGPYDALNSRYNLSRVAFEDTTREVVAGSVIASPSIGVIVVMIMSGGGPAHVFKAPGAGQLRITGFQGDRYVLLNSPTLGNGTFSVVTHAFVWQH